MRSNLLFARIAKVKNTNREGVIIDNVDVGIAYVTPQYLVAFYDGKREWFTLDKLSVEKRG